MVYAWQEMCTCHLAAVLTMGSAGQLFMNIEQGRLPSPQM